MPFQTTYLFSAAMDVEPGKEAIFNEVYDTEHVPLLLRVPGILSVARFQTQELTMIIGGQRKTILVENEPTYNALYELESPEVLTSDARCGIGTNRLVRIAHGIFLCSRSNNRANPP